MIHLVMSENFAYASSKEYSLCNKNLEHYDDHFNGIRIKSQGDSSRKWSQSVSCHSGDLKMCAKNRAMFKELRQCEDVLSEART